MMQKDQERPRANRPTDDDLKVKEVMKCHDQPSPHSVAAVAAFEMTSSPS